MNKMKLKTSTTENMFKAWLQALFGGDTSVVMIKGKPKTGKTDMALFLSQMLIKYRIIHKFASNVYVDNSKERNVEYKYINDMQTLHNWVHKDKISKLYIYDEAITSSPSRRPLARINVAWLTEIPQLSKGRCKLIVITQTEKYSDSVFNNIVFLRATIEKVNRKRAFINCPEISAYDSPFSRIPKTSLSFDPYTIQTFHMKNDKELETDDPDKLLFYEWIKDNKMSFGKITTRLQKEGMAIARTQVINKIKKQARKLFEEHIRHNIDADTRNGVKKSQTENSEPNNA